MNEALATKVDILAIKADILGVKADIEKVKAELEAKIEAATVDLLKWMVMAMVAQGTLIVALIKLL